MTSREGVFAGGDVVHKPATVVLAMREAKKAVDGMVKYMEIKKGTRKCKSIMLYEYIERTIQLNCIVLLYYE